jgi:hypothetical protein
LPVSSLASGALLAEFGWFVVNAVVLLLVVLAGGLLIWLVLRRRPSFA